MPGVSSEEVFINVRQGLYTTGYHFAGCANKAMLNGAHISLVLHEQNWWQRSSPQKEKVNNLVGLDSDSKATRKDVLTLKAACILTCTEDMFFSFSIVFFHTCPIFHTQHTHTFTV